MIIQKHESELWCLKGRRRRRGGGHWQRSRRQRRGRVAGRGAGHGAGPLRRGHQRRQPLLRTRRVTFNETLDPAAVKIRELFMAFLYFSFNQTVFVNLRRAWCSRNLSTDVKHRLCLQCSDRRLRREHGGGDARDGEPAPLRRRPRRRL